MKKDKEAVEIGVAFHDRAYKDVLRRIRHVYGLTEENTVLPETGELTTFLRRSLTADKYRETVDRIDKEDGFEGDAEKHNKINEVSLWIMNEYTNTFFIRHQMYEAYLTDKTTGSTDAGKEQKTEQFYQSAYNKKLLSNVLINHLSNLAELKLQALGINPVSAHALHGVLIGIAVRASKTFPPVALDEEKLKNYTTVNPQQGSLSSTYRLPTRRIERLREYWGKQRDNLVAQYREQVPTPGTGPTR